MTKQAEPKIKQNIRRLLMFNSLNNIHQIIDDEHKSQKKNKRQALVISIISIILLILLLILMTTVTQTENKVFTPDPVIPNES